MPTDLAYDANGNMTTDQNGMTYGYDAWNRMATALPPDASTTYNETFYTYNALGERISRLTTVATGQTNPVLIVNDGNAQRARVRGFGVDGLARGFGPPKVRAALSAH